MTAALPAWLGNAQGWAGTSGKASSGLDSILKFRSPFDNYMDSLTVPRQRRTALRKRPSDAWAEATKRLESEEVHAEEHEVAEALFDLANMFAAAEPVLEAEEAAAASDSPRTQHRAKRQRPKGKGSQQPAVGRYGSQHLGSAAAPNGNAGGFQDTNAASTAAGRDEYAAAAAAHMGQTPGDWDHRSPAAAAAALQGHAAALSGGGAFGAANGALPPNLAGFYGGLPFPQLPSQQQQPLQAGGPGNGTSGFNGGNSIGNRNGGADTRFPRCASHVYIAHFIEYQSKLERQRAAATGVPPAAKFGDPGFFPGAAAQPQYGQPGQQQFGGVEAGGPRKVAPAVPNPNQAIKQEPGRMNGVGQSLPMSGGMPFGGPNGMNGSQMPLSRQSNGGGAPGGLPTSLSAQTLAAQQQQYAQQLSQLAMLSQQGSAVGLPFLPPPVHGGGGFGGGAPPGLTPQQVAAAAPFFNQQLNLAGLLPPNLAHLATSAAGVQQQDMKNGMPQGLDGVKRSPSAARLDEFGGHSGPRAEAEAWAAKLAAAAQAAQAAASNGAGNGGPPNGYGLAEAQLKQFQEAFANAERERKLRTAGLLDGRSMPMHLDPAANGNRMLMH